MKKLLTTIFFTFLLPVSSIYAQTNVSDVLGEEETTTTTVVEEVLEEDGDIKLKMPQQTDNPSYVITFVDPSEEKDGVQLEIDGDRYIKIESPYTLPALGIGSHILKFKYTDDEDAVQTLERTLVVIPRPPIMDSPVISDTSVTLTGTGLAGSELLLTISTGVKTYQYETDISETGTWEFIFSEELSESIYSVQGITRKYGYASNFSDVLTFEIGDIQTLNNEEETSISFHFKDIDTNTLKSLVSTNWELLVFTLSCIVLGIVVGIVFNSLIREHFERKALGNFREKINGGKKDEITLRELFEKDNKKEKEAPKAEEEKKEEVKDEEHTKKEVKVVSKNEFLEVYKEYDPDKENGEEKKPKKKFKISLTSKK
jgi:hypothetical protein